MPRWSSHGSKERVRLENAIRLGARIDEEQLAHLPETDIAASPLLRKALCECWLEQGQLLRARDGLTALIPELAISLLRGPLLSAMALLCLAQVRIGQLDEARSLARFLLEDRDRAKEEADGDVAWALARCVGLLERKPDSVFGEQAGEGRIPDRRTADGLPGDARSMLPDLPAQTERQRICTEACRLYDEAIAAYDREGRSDKALAAEMERMGAYAGRLPDPVWERYAVGLEHRLKRHSDDGRAVLSYLRARRAFACGNVGMAAVELASCAPEADGTMPAEIRTRARVLSVAVAARQRQEAELTSALAAVGEFAPDGSVEVELRFEWTCADCERAVARRDASGAHQAYAKAQTLAGLGLIPEAEERLEQLARLLKDGESEGSYDGPLRLEPQPQPQQPQSSQSQQPQTDSVETQQPQPQPSQSQQPQPDTAEPQGPAPWHVLVFGRIQFERAGQTVRDIHWKRAKAKELLLYLLLQPEYAAPREQVIEALFPNVEPVKADNRFYVTAHQLKRILREHLGASAGVTLRENSIRLEHGLIDYVDAEQYEMLVRTGDQLWATNRTYAEMMYRRAEPLYDTLAPNTPYADWLEGRREQLLARQCELLARLGASAMEAEDYERAEALARERVRLQPLQEEAYQSLLVALLRQGRAAEAESLFRAMEQLLAEQLGALPLADTLRLMGR